MTGKYGTSYKWLLLFGFMLCVYSAKSQMDEAFRSGSEWVYGVYVIDGADSAYLGEVHLRIPCDSTLALDQCQIIWDYRLSSDSTVMEKTLGTFKDDYVEIHPPREGLLSFTEFTPFPRMLGLLGETEGFSSEINTKLIHGWGELNGETIKKKLVVLGIDSCGLKGECLSCHVTEGWNTSHQKELGSYKSRFWFHQNYGFVKMEYWKPGKSLVVLQLQSFE